MQVVHFVFQPVQPLHLLRPAQFRLGAFGQLHEIFQMSIPHAVGVAEVRHLFTRILADGFQQAIAHRARCALASAMTSDLFTSCVSTSSTSSGWIDARRVLIRPDRFRGLQRPAARKDRQPPQQGALGFGEQVVTPVHQRAQGLLARQGRATAAGQQAEGIGQAARRSDRRPAHSRGRRPTRSRAESRRAAGRSARWHSAFSGVIANPGRASRADRQTAARLRSATARQLQAPVADRAKTATAHERPSHRTRPTVRGCWREW